MDLHISNSDRHTAVMVAADYGHTDIVALLLDKGAEIQQRDNTGFTAMMWAAGRGHTDTVRLLLERAAERERSI